jgi:acylphosphatase
LPGIELISFRTPSPGQTNNGKMNWEGASRVSRTRERIASEDRKRRKRCVGKAIQIQFGKSDTEGMKRLARRWLISGRVQGVGFRCFVQDKASSLGVTGWARNLEDGRVEVYGVGDPAALDDLAAALHMGPRMANVRSVEQIDDTPQRTASFQIR